MSMNSNSIASLTLAVGGLRSADECRLEVRGKASSYGTNNGRLIKKKSPKNPQYICSHIINSFVHFSESL
jgi:hypothetical protein